ncbi:MAG: hypothetical protein K2L06_03045 [Alistipes sp.]|nr:hypothetical protein [Alistipes sp.]
MRIFDFALGISAWQNTGELAFVPAYSYVGFALGTSARQKANKLAFALAYSYL